MSDSIPSLHIIGGRKLGGAERFFVRLVNALARHGHAVEVVTVAGGEIDAAVDPQIPRHHAPLAGVWDIWSRLRIGQIVKQRTPAIVQTYMGRATRLTHLPRGGRSIHVARLGGYYDLKGYRHAHAWIGNTRGICDYLMREGLPPARVFHIGNFVDAAPRLAPETLNELRRKWLLPEESLIILGLGRLHSNKGFADLLQAFSRLPAELHGRPLHLVMVGDGPLRSELKAEARRLGMEKRVTWAGWQYDPSPWYQLADVFVCSSRHEPLGNVILEAWANSALVVSTAAEGPLELVTPGEDALLAPLADPAGLADSLLQALEFDDAARRNMIEAGLATLEANFSEAAIVAAYTDLYRRLGTPTMTEPTGVDMEPTLSAQAGGRAQKLSAFVTTFNNDRTLAACLESVKWADEIVVLDSFSTDDTEKIAREYGCKFSQHKFMGYGPQKQMALEQTSNRWVLLLDADEVLSPASQAEIRALMEKGPDADGYSLPRQEQLFWKMSSPKVRMNHFLRLFDKTRGHVSDMPIHAAPKVEGVVKKLEHPFYHFGETSVHVKVDKINHYSTGLVADKQARGKRANPWIMVFYPPLFFVRSYIFKRSFLNGWAGFIGSVTMAYYVFLKYAKLYEAEQFRKHGDSLLPRETTRR